MFSAGRLNFLSVTTRPLEDLRPFVLVPGGVAHTFGNAGTDPARLLIIHAPAMDAYFEELQELWSKEIPPSREDELTLMRRHGMEPAEPFLGEK